MAEIVLGIGTSHSPLLNSPAEDYAKHAENDQTKRKLLDKNGRPISYAELLAQADPAILDQIKPEIFEQRAAQCTANIERLAGEIEQAKLDALIVIGDDQQEQYFDDNMPAVLIYSGETIENNALRLEEEEMPEFLRQARAQYHSLDGVRHYPVDSALALHLVEKLMDNGFDISHAKRLSKPRGEGHAFGFVHQRLMTDSNVIPIVPVALNTYYPPNQPRPVRCYELGQSIRDAVETAPGDARIGVLASGGLSHFTVDEELDRRVLNACRDRDARSLSAIPVQKLNSGNSEIRNWIAVAGACEQLAIEWQEYIPCYRSAAGTGCGMGFAVWT
jgi:3-O-methylgallate 3,4-dioxygenase